MLVAVQAERGGNVTDTLARTRSQPDNGRVTTVATGDLPGRLDGKPQANGGINSLARTTVGTELGVLPNLSSYYLQALA